MTLEELFDEEVLLVQELAAAQAKLDGTRGLIKAMVKMVVKPAKSVSARCRQLILAGLTDDQIWNVIQPELNLKDDKKTYPGWNRRKMKRDGLI